MSFEITGNVKPSVIRVRTTRAVKAAILRDPRTLNTLYNTGMVKWHAGMERGGVAMAVLEVETFMVPIFLFQAKRLLEENLHMPFECGLGVLIKKVEAKGIEAEVVSRPTNG